MRTLALAVLVAACAPANYYYNFDIAEPNAKNSPSPQGRDVIEDADVKAEILVDPTSFQAILLDLTNKTDQTMGVNWDQISIINPDGVATAVKPDSQLGWIQPGTKIVARLLPFTLPSQGAAATAYDESKFVLVVPMVVRGQQKDVRYHLVSHIVKQ